MRFFITMSVLLFKISTIAQETKIQEERLHFVKIHLVLLNVFVRMVIREIENLAKVRLLYSDLQNYEITSGVFYLCRQPYAIMLVQSFLNVLTGFTTFDAFLTVFRIPKRQ